MRRLFSKKAQSTLEYAILIAVIVGALIGMQTYVKRGLQGRLKVATDDVGSQFEPGTTDIHSLIVTAPQTQESVTDAGSVRTETVGGETSREETRETPWSFEEE